MFGLFKYDGSFVQICNKIVDTICLSLLWLVTSIPIVTMGAATTALYYAINTGIRYEQGHIWRAYWKSFRNNFKQATVIWLLLLAVYGLLGASCYCTYKLCMNSMLPKEMFYILLVILALVMTWANLLFPYLAKFQNTTKVILKNCFGIGLLSLPKAVLQTIFFALVLLGTSMFPMAILFAPGIYMVLSCYTLEPVFRKYMSEEDRAKEEAILQDLKS